MPEKRFVPPRSRRTGYRDARLIVIASEGMHTEPVYFNGLANNYRTQRVHVHLVEKPNTDSDPERVIKLLDDFKRTYSLNLGYDELWLVSDVDRWGAEKLSRVCTLCSQKRYRLAVSNPCFELWLLLHLRDLQGLDAETISELQANKRTGNRTRLEVEIVALVGAYNKSNPNMAHFLPGVTMAVQRARALSLQPWPPSLGSGVYALAESIISGAP